MKDRLAQTLGSLAAQTTSNWRIVLVANHGADLPRIPPNVEVKRVDFPPNPQHERGDVNDETLWDTVRLDKGRRILAGMLHPGRADYLMVVDDDDFVSCRLAEFVARHDGENGWYIKRGYVWPNAGRILYSHADFSKYCGTSHIVRADLYKIPECFEEASESYIKRMLGSHIFIDDHLRASGTPLVPLPFPGAIYRIGHIGAVTKSAGLLRTFFLNRRIIRNPTRLVDAAFRLRLLTPRVRAEFWGRADR